MNTLLTCAGRRNYLVQFFKQATGSAGHVIACDSSNDAPAFLDADLGVVVPRVDHPEYFDVLVDLCRKHHIGLLIPVFDPELAGLAQHAQRFRDVGAVPVISTPEVLAICQDKWRSFEFLRSCGVPAPATFRTIADVRAALKRDEIRFPLLIKPRWGVSSIGVERIDHERELDLAFEWGKIQLARSFLARLCHGEPETWFVFQEFLQGQEFGMDVVNDLEGSYAATFARRKLAMRSGNTDRAVTVSEARFEPLAQAISAGLHHVGCLDCDLIETDRGLFVLDLNPRFGGGYPFSHLAGANLPAALMAWVRGAKANPEWLQPRPGLQSSKFDGVAVVDKELPSATLSRSDASGNTGRHASILTPAP